MTAPFRSIRVHCFHCDTTVAAEVKGHYQSYDGHPDEGGLRLYHLLAMCPQCSGPILAETTECGPDEHSPPAVKFPAPGMKTDPTWPAVLVARFSEAESCLRVRAYNAAAVMCRRTMEQVCSELTATGRNLYEQLADLRQRGILDPNLLEWANGLRALGNVGAHAGSEDVTAQDARDSLEFARAVIDYVFAYKRKFEEFKARRTPPPVTPAT